MRKLILATLALLLITTTSRAGDEFYVASTGTNAGSCTRARPCRTIQYVLDKVSPYAEIVILDAGEFGPANITQAVSIVNESSGVAHLSASSPAAASILVNITNDTLNDTVTLKGLTVDSHLENGIFIRNALKVYIANCRVSRSLFA